MKKQGINRVQRGVKSKVTGVTDSKLRTMMVSALRRVFRNSSRRVFINKRKYKNNGTYNRKFKYLLDCQECSRTSGVYETEVYYTKSGRRRRRAIMNVDHITPCGQVRDTKKDLGPYAHNLIFNDLQVLCYDCHLKKTIQENTKKE